MDENNSNTPGSTVSPNQGSVPLQQPAATVQSTTETPQAPAGPQPVQPAPKGKLPKWLAPVVIAVVLIGGGSAAAYYGIQSRSPENRLEKAFSRLLDEDQMKLTASTSEGEAQFELELGINQTQQAFEGSLSIGGDGMDIALDLRSVNEKVYFNATKLDIGSLGGDFGGFDLSVLEEQWFELSSDDAGDALGQSCDASLLTFTDEDKDKLGDIYDMYPLFAVEDMGEADVNGTSATKLKLIPTTNEQAEEFFTKVRNEVAIVKALEECSGEELDTDFNEDSEPSEQEFVYVYLDGSNLVRAELKMNDNNLVIDFDLDAEVNVQAPEDAKSYEELQSLLFSSLFGGFDFDSSFDLDSGEYDFEFDDSFEFETPPVQTN